MSADLTAGAQRVAINVPVSGFGETKIEIVGAADKVFLRLRTTRPSRGKSMSQQAGITLAKIDLENLPSQESWKSIRLLSVNGNNVKLRVMRNMKAPWHRHEDSDELFIVQTGTITMDVRDQLGKVSSYSLTPGQLLAVHRGTEHRARCTGSATLIVIDGFA